MIKIAVKDTRRLRTRLHDHNEFTHTMDGVGSNGGLTNAGVVELIKPPETDRLANCADICISICCDTSSEFSCSCVYVSTTKVEQTAEKRPA